MQTKRRPWTEARRKKQAQNCKKTKPWTQATGPKSTAGKARIKHNALRHGFHSQDMRHLRKLLHQQLKFVQALLSRHPS